MMRLIASFLVVFCFLTQQAPAVQAGNPNIVLIYADDIGYGDFGCYGATKVKTPNVDRLAAAGLRFTDAHSVASVCTPSRYSLLTGRYAFRKKGTGIASGIEGLLIEPGRTTLASLLKRAGYATGVVGKWHLGLGTTPTDYNREIKPGPLELGFDYAWILPATGDRVPCVWVENRRVVNLDPSDPIKLDYSVARGQPRSYVAGIPRIGEQVGGRAAVWKDEEMSGVIAEKSCTFIEKHKDRPFFLYMATHNIHVPRAPNPRFVGKSDCGVRGDAIVEFDWTVGQVLDAIERLGLTEKTLVILMSDNGGVLDNNGPDVKHGIGSPEANNGHACNGVLRGTKGSLFEGGTRLPLIVRWPPRVKPGTSDALVSQIDLSASFAALTGQTLADADAPDSHNVLPALLGESKEGRQYLVTQNNDGHGIALRKGSWKYIPGQGNAGMGGKKKPDGKGPSVARPSGALYDLAKDLSETTNVAAEHPELVKELAATLAEIKASKKTRP